MKKLEKIYYNACKKLETFKRINFNDEELNHAMQNLTLQENYEKAIVKEKENQKFATIASLDFDVKSMRQIIKELLVTLPKIEYRLPLINYALTNTNNGNEISKFLLENLSLKDFDQAEVFGQELLNLGFLKYCNGVGATFVNSKKFQYQWKDYAYRFAQIQQDDEIPAANGVDLTSYQTYLTSKDILSTEKQTPQTELAEGSPNISENEKNLFQLVKEAGNSDKDYKRESIKLDSLRCSLEELITDHLAFMEKCELDRLKAIKKATVDFCSTIGNKISVLKLCVDEIMNTSEGIDPTSDLLNLISEYRTGTFQPHAIIYNNYYNPGIFQTFGIDLDTRCRLDGKVVPILISALLSNMDKVYPDLPNDKVRTSVWISPVKLSLTHQLRTILNKGNFKSESDIEQVLSNSAIDPGTITSVLKIYLLELPDPLITNNLIEVLRLLYSEYPPIPITYNSEKAEVELQQPTDEEEEQQSKRIVGLYTTLSGLTKPSLATLDALTTHFCRLIQIIQMGENGAQLAGTFKNDISKEFASCIVHSTLCDGNDLGYKIFHDLLTFKKTIFRHLKRQDIKGGNTPS